MKKWKKTSYMVAVYMFFIDLRPLEPYLTAYQIGPNGNISLYEVANTMVLIKSYAMLFGSLVMLITADYLLYKPNIIFLTVWTFFSYFLLIGTPSELQIMAARAGIGATHCANIIAFSYMYAQINDIHQFQMATGIVSAAMQIGKVFGDIIAEVIVSTTGGIYTALPYCNMFSMFLAIISSSLFPKVEQKNGLLEENVPNENSRLLKHEKDTPTEYCEKTQDEVVFNKEQNKVLYMSKEIWTNLKTSYSNLIVLKISVWYVLGMAALISVLSNINVLYSYVVELPGNHDTLSNGLSEALVTLFGAVGAYAIGKVRIDWTCYGDIFTTFCSIIMGVFMMSCYFFENLYLIYTSYILFNLVNQAHLVIIMSEIAKQLKYQCYSLVFVTNYLGSSIITTIMTTYFINVTIPGRFLFIGGLFIILGIIFLFISLLKGVKNKCFH